jgi:hypothetical protein
MFFATPFAMRARRVASALALAGLCTCAGIDNFDVDVDGQASIPKATLVEQLLGDIDFPGFDSIDLSQEFKNQGVTKDDVDSVHLKSMTFTIDSPSDGNFDFLDSLTFFAEADGQKMVQIASISPVPKGQRTLELVVEEDVDLQPYVVAPSMRLSSHIEGQRPDEDTTVTAAVTLDVDVHVPGCN